MATTVIVGGPKLTETLDSYMEFCPRCQENRMTRVETSLGTCWWIVLLLGCVLLWPLWYWLCCKSSKDVKHSCPNCGTLLAVRKGGC